MQRLSQHNKTQTKNEVSFLLFCLSERIEEQGVQPLLDFLAGNLTWPVLTTAWKEEEYDEIGTMATLQGGYSNSILVDFYVGTDDTNSSIYVLQVSKPGSLPLRKFSRVWWLHADVPHVTYFPSKVDAIQYTDFISVRLIFNEVMKMKIIASTHKWPKWKTCNPLGFRCDVAGKGSWFRTRVLLLLFALIFTCLLFRSTKLV